MGFVQGYYKRIVRSYGRPGGHCVRAEYPPGGSIVVVTDRIFCLSYSLTFCTKVSIISCAFFSVNLSWPSHPIICPFAIFFVFHKKFGAKAWVFYCGRHAVQVTKNNRLWLCYVQDWLKLIFWPILVVIGLTMRMLGCKQTNKQTEVNKTNKQTRHDRVLYFAKHSILQSNENRLIVTIK